MKPVTDPALLAELEGKPVTDPALLEQLEGKKREPSDTAVTVNSVNKAIAAAPDMLLNAPANLINLGKAAFGMGAHAVGRSDLAPDVTDPPNLARGAFESMGFIRPEAEPANARQRIIDKLAQGGTSALMSPANGIKQAIANTVTGTVAGGVGGAVEEATDNPALGVAASMAAGARMAGAPKRAQDRADALALKKSANEVEDATLKAGQAKGYVVPPADVVPDGLRGFVNKRLTSIAGKDATKQEVTNRNASTTNTLSAEELGFPRGTALTEAKLDAYRSSVSGPYRDVASLSPVASKALDDLKEVRAEAKVYHQHYDRSADPKSLKEAERLDKEAERLETVIDRVAVLHGKPDLVDDLREARKLVAKSYDVERGLNVGSGDVSAPSFGRALNKGKPISGNLEVAGKMQQAFPRYMGDAPKTPTPGVSKIEAVAAALMGGGGAAAFGPPGLALAALPLASGPTRELILSKPYQRVMAERNYSPGMIDRVLSQLPPGSTEEQALRALLMSRAVAERQGAQQ